MGWKLKDLKGLSAPVENKMCTVDEAVRQLKNKYAVDVETLTKIATDVLVKYLTEHKISLEDIFKKYNIKEIKEIVEDILKLAGQ
ncbi:MAG: hypothetical protein RRA45_05215 [Saccharolobus sp.]|jgi:hypothetical protein|uniref:hypothetical protein n=1 Tax=Saccharolobus sp. TaxID=2100761 RepID=UPI0028CF2306|nr:hypothetical protein [Saccharolobus sp.]MDT7861592.1 hypothetical protein [Saccharolobus sp.]